MSQYNKHFVFFLLLVNVLQVNAFECNDIRATDWMLGNWQTSTGNSVISESWQLIDGKNRIGSSTTQKKSDLNPPFVETLRIVEMSDHVFYLAKTPQNKLPIAFKLVECSEQKLKFENLEHDFPNFIEYQKSSSEQIEALVSGIDAKGFKLSFNRLKPTSEIEIVRQFINAYNRKDLSAMLSYADESVQWMSVKNGIIVVETRDKKALDSAMENYFKAENTSSSQLFGVSKNGQFVSGIEKASWKSGSKTMHQCAPVVYQVEQSLIKNVWYFPAEKCDNPYP